METLKNILTWIKDKAEAFGIFVYNEFKQYPQYGWPTLTGLIGLGLGYYLGVR